MVAWLSGSMLVSINVVTQPLSHLRKLTPFILLVSINEYRQYAGVKV